MQNSWFTVRYSLISLHLERPFHERLLCPHLFPSLQCYDIATFEYGLFFKINMAIIIDVYTFYVRI